MHIDVKMKKAGILEWMDVMPGLSFYERERFLAENEEMVRNLRRMGLPTDRDFGSFDSIDEATLVVPESYKLGRKFIVRCPHRTEKRIERALFVTWQQVLDFVAHLPDGYRQYRIGIREVSEPKWAGTIIASNGGEHVLVEIWKGKHLEMDSGGAQTSFRGELGGLERPWRYVWSANCTDDIKRIALGAIGFIAPDLRPKRSVFIEFAFTGSEYRFIGASYHPFWTGDLVTAVSH